MIWNKTGVRLVPDQSENGKYILFSVWFNRISKIFLFVQIKPSSIRFGYQTAFNSGNFSKFLTISRNFLQFHSISHNFSQFLTISLYFSQFLAIFHNFSQFLTISHNFSQILAISRNSAHLKVQKHTKKSFLNIANPIQILIAIALFRLI